MKKVTKKEYENYNKIYISVWCRGNQSYNFSEVLKTIEKEDAKERITKGKGCWGKHYILNEIPLFKEFSIREIANEIRIYVQKASKLRIVEQ